MLHSGLHPGFHENRGWFNDDDDVDAQSERVDRRRPLHVEAGILPDGVPRQTLLPLLRGVRWP